MSRVLLVISARVPAGGPPPGGPRKDYRVLAEALDADMLDQSAVEAWRSTRWVRKLFGVAAAQALLAFRQREAYSAIVTDGEHIGIPLALLLMLARAKAAHVTIGHRLAAPKKRFFFRWLKLHHYITRIALHSNVQGDLSQDVLKIPAEQIALVPYQVDTEFWTPQPQIAEERLICSAGLEYRDYPTLFEAAKGLDIRVIVGAASYWSKRRNTANEIPEGVDVQVGSLDYQALREVYARAAIVVVPLADVDFQAGVTTILEAMAMGKPVIVTHTIGQTDVVEDRRGVTRGTQPRFRPLSFTRLLARQAGYSVEPTGFYVPPSDPAALHRAIAYLLQHPDERARLGEAGRRTVERLFTVDQFAQRMRELVDEARTVHARDVVATVSASPQTQSSARPS
jgi:glycosyltransferase involved in cell wall biosynthesis